MDRLPPQDLDAEKGVLGSILLDPRVCDDVALLIRPDDFYADANRKLYGHLLALHEDGKRIDALLLTARLKEAADLEAIGGVAYIAEVAQSAPHAANASHYAGIVRQKATMRALIHAGNDILATAYNPTADTAEAVSEAEQSIFAVHDGRTTHTATTAHDLIQRAFDRIDAIMEGTAGVGIKTGFTDLDRLTGGLHDSELIILACRPSMGKTAMATNIAEHAAVELKVPVLFISLEMAEVELAQRMLCSMAEVDGERLRSGSVSAADRKSLVESSGPLSASPLFIDDAPSKTLVEIAATARRHKRKHNLGLLIIDYLQLIQPDNARDPRQEQVAKMARRLKGLARELKIPVLCLAQLNRQVEAGTEVQTPRLSHLRESGAIEQDADVVIFIHRPEAYLTQEDAREGNVEGKAIIKVAKQRNGPTGEITLAWFKKFTHFRNHSSRTDEWTPTW